MSNRLLHFPLYLLEVKYRLPCRLQKLSSNLTDRTSWDKVDKFTLQTWQITTWKNQWHHSILQHSTLDQARNCTRLKNSLGCTNFKITIFKFEACVASLVWRLKIWHATHKKQKKLDVSFAADTLIKLSVSCCTKIRSRHIQEMQADRIIFTVRVVSISMPFLVDTMSDEWIHQTCGDGLPKVLRSWERGSNWFLAIEI